MPELWLTPAPVIIKRSGFDSIKFETSMIEFKLVVILLSPLSRDLRIIEKLYDCGKGRCPTNRHSKSSKF
jgi:hypothetical protein